MITLFFRTVIIYLILVAALRLTGKRQIGELQISELVVTFMLSELAVYPITDKNIPMLHSVIPIVLLLSLEIVFSFLQTKSRAFRNIFSGKPTVIIRRGKLIPKALAENRLDIEELFGELRLKGIFDISDVEYAFLEENGKLSVLPTALSSPLTPSSFGFSIAEKGMAHLIISDGTVNDAELSEVSKDRIWLGRILDRLGARCDDVFLMSINDSGDVTAYISVSDEKGADVRRIKLRKSDYGNASHVDGKGRVDL